MNLQEIKNAVNEGKKVHWSNAGYVVKNNKLKNGEDDWVIQFVPNGHVIGLTWADEKTLNGKEEDFFIGEKMPFSIVKNIDKLDSQYEYSLCPKEALISHIIYIEGKTGMLLDKGLREEVAKGITGGKSYKDNSDYFFCEKYNLVSRPKEWYLKFAKG